MSPGGGRGRARTKHAPSAIRLFRGAPLRRWAGRSSPGPAPPRPPPAPGAPPAAGAWRPACRRRLAPRLASSAVG